MSRRVHRRIDQPIRDLATHPHPFMTVHVLAEYLEVSNQTIIRMIHARALPAERVGREWRLPTAGVCQALPSLAQIRSA